MINLNDKYIEKNELELAIQYNKQEFVKKLVYISSLVIFMIVILIFLLVFCPIYRVWASEMHGKAKLAEAEQSRQIMIAEAKAKKESAIFEAEAEVERAKGMAKANQIVGDSLDGHANYLMYLYIQNMQKTQNQIIYIPTEGGMPILEAQRLNRK